MKKYFFVELGFILCKAEQSLLMEDFVLKYFLVIKAVAMRTKTPSVINQMLLIFIYGSCYQLITPKVLKLKNTLGEFNRRRCWEGL